MKGQKYPLHVYACTAYLPLKPKLSSISPYNHFVRRCLKFLISSLRYNGKHAMSFYMGHHNECTGKLPSWLHSWHLSSSWFFLNPQSASDDEKWPWHGHNHGQKQPLCSVYMFVMPLILSVSLSIISCRDNWNFYPPPHGTLKETFIIKQKRFQIFTSLIAPR